MKSFTINKNKYLTRDVKGYYNTDYVSYQKQGNPDFINHLKNMTKQFDEMDLVKDYMEVAERFTDDVKLIIEKNCLKNPVVCVIPRSKTDSSYSQSQLMFRKAISSSADTLRLINATNVIKRVKDTKTTHNWRLTKNTGDDPYVGITKDTCEINKNAILGKDVILVDDIYTEGVFVAEDCLQTLLDFGAKSVILYVIAKTRS